MTGVPQIAGLDERLAKSAIRDGWIARTHFFDAAATLWLEGELVHLEDLVLHDAGMDVRAPTHELTRAHAILRTRRRIAGAEPGWALSAAGLDALRGRGGAARDGADEVDDAEPVDDEREASEPLAAGDDEFSELFVSVDAAIAHAETTLAGRNAGPAAASEKRDSLVYDLDWNEDERLGEWRAWSRARRLARHSLRALGEARQMRARLASRRSTLPTFRPAAGDHAINVFITPAPPSQRAGPPAHHHERRTRRRLRQESIRPLVYGILSLRSTRVMNALRRASVATLR